MFSWGVGRTVLSLINAQVGKSILNTNILSIIFFNVFIIHIYLVGDFMGVAPVYYPYVTDFMHTQAHFYAR